MDSLYIQNLRYKLQKRVRRLNSAHWLVYHSNLQQFWQFLTGHMVLQGILDDLLMREPSAAETARAIVEDHKAMICSTEAEAAAVAAHVIRRCSESDASSHFESNIGFLYARESKQSDNQRCLTEVFVEPLYEYIDEQLDDRGAMLALLRRYKHKVEWFQREQLFGKWSSETRKGEKALALHLYEYLHDQGVQFYIEPASVSGEADLVSAQEGAEPLIADAKVFDPDRGKSVQYLISGFRQIYTYCLDYNQSVGYLVIFKTSENDLKLALRDEVNGTPFAVLNGKVIYFVIVDIFHHVASASKRGRVKAYELSENELVSTVVEEQRPTRSLNRTDTALSHGSAG